MACGYYHSEKDRREAQRTNICPKSLQPFECLQINCQRPHCSLIVTNPNHLNHFLRSFHIQIQGAEKLWGFDLDTLHNKFQFYGIHPLLLRFIEERGVVPNSEMHKGRIRSN